MTNRIPHEIIERASEWFIANRDEQSEHEAFADWLRQSPDHVQAYLEVTSLWTDAAGIDTRIEAEVGESNVVPLLKAENLKAENLKAESPGLQPSALQPSALQPSGVTFRHPLRALAASMLIAAALGSAIWWQFLRVPVYSAAVGEQRTLTLEDGSVVRLNSRSRVRVQLSPEQRDVELLAGQALFEVAKDAKRPFVVQSGDVSIRAVGTSFDVYRKSSGTVVTVVEGSVLVHELGASAVPLLSQNAMPQIGSITVSAGEQVTVNKAGAIEHKPNVNIAAATSWLQQELIFTGEPLNEVIAEFNRYTRRTIVLMDSSLAELRINAVFHSTNPDALLKFISRYDGVEVTETETEIRIARK